MNYFTLFQSNENKIQRNLSSPNHLQGYGTNEMMSLNQLNIFNQENKKENRKNPK